MSAFEFNVAGIKEVVARMRQTSPDQRLQAAGAGIYEFANDVMTVAKTDAVPVKDGILRASGHVDAPTIEGNEVSVKTGFGGPSAPYAAKQHEDTTLHHTVGEAKFWERPLMAAINGMLPRTGESLSDIVGF